MAQPGTRSASRATDAAIANDRVGLDGPFDPAWLTLRPFAARYAAVVAGWVNDEDDLFRLAPGTRSPLTAAKVVAWTSNGGCGWLLAADGRTRVSGYAELNSIDHDPGALWLGHLILDPDARGRGWGHRLVSSLVSQAFGPMAASAIVLVVFPDNEPAIRCYQRAGFRVRREESHRFRGRRRHRMLRMELVNPNPQTRPSVRLDPACGV